MIKTTNDYCIIIGGFTMSSDYPTANAYDTTRDGLWDSIITQINSTGTGLDFSTYFGGSDTDGIHDIVIDDVGYIYVLGTTSSSDFPLVNEYQSYSFDQDIFVSVFNSTATGLHYSTCIGGTGYDYSYCIHYIVDRTSSLKHISGFFHAHNKGP